MSYRGGASQGSVQSPGQESPIVWPKLKNLHSGDTWTSSCPPYHEGFQTVEKITGIRIPHVPSIPNQTGVHRIFSSLYPMMRTWKQSPWGATLREGGRFNTFSLMRLVLQRQPAICRKDSYCKKDPSGPALTTVGTLELNRRPNTLSRASREACSAKLKEKGRKNPFSFHSIWSFKWLKILAHRGYKISHFCSSKTRAKPAHNSKHFFHMFVGKLSFSPSPSAAWD